MTDKKMTLEDWLDDLCVRFIINLPRADLSTVERICFQVEEAQWFYEDFIRPTDAALPQLTLRTFCSRIFAHCPLLSPFADNHMEAFDEFMQYKSRVPVRGAILLNEEMDSAVLVKGWKSGAGWSFPRGKINMDEDDLDCAIREVDEEIGFDIRRAGLVPQGDDVKYIEVTMKGQQIRLYVFRNIPMETYFEPKTRKEISKIAWYKLSELPGTKKKGNNGEIDVAPPQAALNGNNNKFYMVAPFLGQLKKWVAQQKRKGAATGRPTAISQARNSYLGAQSALEEPLTEDDFGGQTDKAAEEPTPVPSIETVEGANKTLQQLLNLQPPTQGLQLDNPVESMDKGSALMALLKSNDPLAQQTSQVLTQHAIPTSHTQVPHTPFDLVYSEAPQPNTPHHHDLVQQLLQPDDYQAPPNFPLAQHINPNSQFNQNLPFNQQQQQQHQHQHQHQYNQQQYPNQQPSFQHLQGRNMPGPNYYNNFAANQAQLMQHQHQQQLHLQQQQIQQQLHQQQQYMNQQRLNHMGPSQQPQKAPEILHPQPLPPQAQSILTRSMLPTPQLPETTAKPGPAAFGTMESQLATSKASHGRGHVQQRSVNQLPPQMDSHTMSLLNAFKTAPARNAEPKTNQASQGQPAPVPALAQHYQQGLGPAPQLAERQQGPLHLPVIPAIANLHQQQLAAAKPISYDGPAPVQHHQAPQPDTHRAALLDMFKKPAPLSPASGSDATVKPARPVEERPLQNPMFARAALQPQPTAQTTAVATGAQGNRGPVVMNPEGNLPFRATQILSRAKQGEHAPSNATNGQVPLPVTQPKSSAQLSVIPQASNPYNAPQGLGYAFHPEAPNAPYNHPQQPNSAVASPKFPGAPLLHGRLQENNPEQAMKLLSLFGKPQPSHTGLNADDKGKMKETIVMERPKSRVASFSLASATGDVVQNGHGSAPRRGSATPISPNDRDFLMNYLASAVAKQGL